MEDDDEKRQRDPEDDRQSAQFMPMTMESEHIVSVRWSYIEERERASNESRSNVAGYLFPLLSRAACLSIVTCTRSLR